MAFLKLKMAHHIDKTISLQLQENPIDISGKPSGYEGTIEYHLPCVNIGGSYYAAPQKDREPFKIKTAQAFDFNCSIALYKKLVDFQKGELLDVTMEKTADGKIRYKIEGSSKEWTKPVEDTRSATETSYGYKSIKERDITTQDNIRFGMAFNNATKIACSCTGESKDKVKIVAKIMPQMWEIVNSLDSLMEEPAQEVGDDDLPF